MLDVEGRRESFELLRVSRVSEVLSEPLALLLALIAVPLHYMPSTAPSFVARDKRVFGRCIIWGFFGEHCEMHLSKSPSPNPFVRDAHKGGRCNQSPGASVPLIFEVEGSFKVPWPANPALFQGASLGTTWMELARALWGLLGLCALCTGQLAALIL